MSTRQKIGLVLVVLSIAVTLTLQTSFSLLYSPEQINDIDSADLTPAVFILATNWMIVAPLLCVLVGGMFCFLFPRRISGDEPQLVKIKYVR